MQLILNIGRVEGVHNEGRRRRSGHRIGSPPSGSVFVNDTSALRHAVEDGVGVGQELVWGVKLGDGSLIQHHNTVRIQDSVESMRYSQHRAVGKNLTDRNLRNQNVPQQTVSVGNYCSRSRLAVNHDKRT